ncbi:MAG: PD-(D/E)XK nuclease family protein [Paracoccaceae bacterium]|nr:PD-(D/E)XK nuclease family protein [Paracoccaceae bacterium]
MADKMNTIPDPSSIVFPTGKPHVSYSEVRAWKECPWRHKLLYIDKLGKDEPSPYLSYGSALHDGIENFLKTGLMNIEAVLENITSEWEKYGFDTEEWIKSQADYRKSQGWKPKAHDYLPVWLEWATNSLQELPDFLKEEFGDYEVISAEEQLYEYYPGTDIFFKGFIDALFKVQIRGKEYYYVIDWKTAGDKGWYANKKRDILTWAQIALYKTFWKNKNGIDIKQVKCGFVLLKRGGKPGNICELVKVSVGPKAEDKAMSIFRSMVKNVRRGLFLKNRASCLFCEFKNTSECPGSR